MQTQPYVNVSYITITIDETYGPFNRDCSEKLLNWLYRFWNPTDDERLELIFEWVKHEKT